LLLKLVIFLDLVFELRFREIRKPTSIFMFLIEIEAYDIRIHWRGNSWFALRVKKISPKKAKFKNAILEKEDQLAKHQTGK